MVKNLNEIRFIPIEKAPVTQLIYRIDLNTTPGFYFLLWVYEPKLQHKKTHKNLLLAVLKYNFGKLIPLCCLDCESKCCLRSKKS